MALPDRFPPVSHSLSAHRGDMVALPVIDLASDEQRQRLDTHSISRRQTFGT
jgi:hypothetical protein